jgi:hypothetical protein
MPQWKPQGTHRYYEEEDVLFWESHGLITLSDMEAAFRALEGIQDRHGYVIGIFDARDKVSVSPEARRYTAAQGRGGARPAATIIIGASATLRTIMRLLHNAYRLFGLNAPTTHYCVSVDDAFVGAQRERQKLREELAAEQS